MFEIELFDKTELLEIEVFFTLNLCTYAKNLFWNLYKNGFGIK